VKIVTAIYICLFTSFYCLSTSADSWLPGLQDRDNTYKFGELECRLTVKEKRPKSGWTMPEGTFACKKNGAQVFEKQNLGADIVVASEDAKYILGISNSGLHHYAFWIVDLKGKVIAKMTHDSKEIKYCHQSVTIFRTWFNSVAKPVFVFRNGSLADITLISCNESQISLNKLDPFKL